jgi:hypothetical protein
MFYKRNDTGYKQVLQGIKLKTLVYGKNTLFSEFRLEATSSLPKHAHPHEQTGYLVEGVCENLGFPKKRIPNMNESALFSRSERASRRLSGSMLSTQVLYSRPSLLSSNKFFSDMALTLTRNGLI